MKVLSAFITVFMTIAAAAAIFMASLAFGSTAFSLILGIFLLIPTIATILGCILVLPAELVSDAYESENVRQLNSYRY